MQSFIFSLLRELKQAFTQTEAVLPVENEALFDHLFIK